MCANGGHSLRILFFIFDAAAEVCVEAGFGAIVLIGNTTRIDTNCNGTNSE